MKKYPDFFEKQYWKWIAIILLSIVLVGGMLVPLSGGIVSMNPFRIQQTGNQRFIVETYNCFLIEENLKTSFWLKNNNDYISIKNAIIESPNLIVFEINLDSTLISSLKSKTFDFVLNNDKCGTVTLRDAFSLDHKFASLLNTKRNDSIFSEPEVKRNTSPLFGFPFREILLESIRNTFYHVPMWFSMLFLLIVSLIFSIKYLNTSEPFDDLMASSAVTVSLVFAICGLITGMIWAKHTWGAYWPNDPKLNGAAIGVAVYLAYLVLRSSVKDEIKRARIASVYNIFAFVIYILFIFILPRITDSLHPGNGGNPAFSKYDLDSHMRLFFYPAIIGWILLSVWILSILVRIKRLEFEKYEKI